MDRPLIIHTPTSKQSVAREALPDKLWELTGGLAGKSGTKLYHSQAHAQNLRRQLLRLAEMTGVGRDKPMIKAMLQKYAREDEQKSGLAPGSLHSAATASAGEHGDKSLHLYLSNRSQHLTENPSPWLHNPDMGTHVDWDHSAYEQAHRWTPRSLEVRAVLPREIPPSSRIISNVGDNGEYHLRHSVGTPLVLKAHDYTQSLRRAEAATNANPSQAQWNAENYSKGSFQWRNLTITIENPKGSIRRGKNPDKPWQVTMGCAYGYFNSQPLGRDGDPVDVFVCDDNLDSELVFVVNQVQQDGKSLDEHKVVIGCNNERDARKAYLSCYSAGWTCGSIKALHIEEFRKWLASGKRGVLKALGARPIVLKATILPSPP